MKAPTVLWVAVLLVFSAAAAPALADGAADYTKLCAKCHGAEGKGDGPAAKMFKNQSMGDLSSKAAMSKTSDADMYKMIAEGGPAVGKSKLMPAHKDKLNEAALKALIAYMKTLQK